MPRANEVFISPVEVTLIVGETHRDMRSASAAAI